MASWLVRSTPDRAVRVGSPGRAHCVVFLSDSFYSNNASLHPVVQMGTGKCNDGGKHSMDEQLDGLEFIIANILIVSSNVIVNSRAFLS